MTARSPYRVAVVGDGSAHPHTEAARPLATALAADADAIERLGGVRVVAVPASASGDGVVTRLRELPDDVAAALVTRTDYERARAAQHVLDTEDGRPVLTEEDSNAVALTASALAYLRRIGHRPGAARVLVVGASGMPVLTPLLIGCGIQEVNMWNRSDERWFPLRRAVRDADVVLDLLRSPEMGGLAPDRPDGSILAAGVANGLVVAAPGMLRALAEYPPGTADVGIEQYCECAHAIAVAVATRSRPWRPPRDPHISHAVAAAFRRSAGRQHEP